MFSIERLRTISLWRNKYTWIIPRKMDSVVSHALHNPFKYLSYIEDQYKSSSLTRREMCLKRTEEALLHRSISTKPWDFRVLPEQATQSKFTVEIHVSLIQPHTFPSCLATGLCGSMNFDETNEHEDDADEERISSRSSHTDAPRPASASSGKNIPVSCSAASSRHVSSHGNSNAISFPFLSLGGSNPWIAFCRKLPC